MNSKVTAYLNKAKKWQAEQRELRAVVDGCGLKEEFKWGHPCYTLDGRNVVLIHAFKEYAAILFFKGVLLKDPKGILIQQTKNVQAGRQVRFTSVGEIVKMKVVLKQYIKEAIKVEKAGLKVELKKDSDYEIPEELQYKLDSNIAFREAFYALTPGRRHGYIFYFSQPKQSKTREARIEKCTDQIMDGLGLNDGYVAKSK